MVTTTTMKSQDRLDSQESGIRDSLTEDSSKDFDNRSDQENVEPLNKLLKKNSESLEEENAEKEDKLDSGKFKDVEDVLCNRHDSSKTEKKTDDAIHDFKVRELNKDVENGKEVCLSSSLSYGSEEEEKEYILPKEELELSLNNCESSTLWSQSTWNQLIIPSSEQDKIFEMFIDNERSSLVQKFPSYSPKRILTILNDQWTHMNQSLKNNKYMTDVSDILKKEEESCPSKICDRVFHRDTNRQTIMKHWFKEHSLSELHNLYTSSLWKSRIPQSSQESVSQSFRFKDEGKTTLLPKINCSSHISDLGTESSKQKREDNEQKFDDLLNGVSKSNSVSLLSSVEDDVKEIKSQILQAKKIKLNQCRKGISKIFQRGFKKFSTFQSQGLHGSGKRKRKVHSSNETAILKCEFKPGDLVWACLGSYWPSVITYDPDSLAKVSSVVEDAKEKNAMDIDDEIIVDNSKDGIFTRVSSRGRRKSFREFHVDFFGGMQRAWIPRSHIMKYRGLSDFDKEAKKIKLGKSIQQRRLFRSFHPANQIKSKWDRAVKDAELTINMMGIQRLHILKELQEKNQNSSGESRKRKRGDSVEEPQHLDRKKFKFKSQKFSGALALINAIPETILRSQRRKLKTGIKLFHLANISTLKISHPNSSDKELESLLNIMWSRLTKHERIFYQHERQRLAKLISLDVSKDPPSSSSSLSPSSSSSHLVSKETSSKISVFPSSLSQKTSKFEVIGVFKNERYCLICEDVSKEPGDLLTCKGICQNSFHLTCLQVNGNISNIGWKCEDCLAGLRRCHICKTCSEEVNKCAIKACYKYYHQLCLTASGLWPQTVVGPKAFTCPAHVCHTCASEHPNDPITKINTKIMKCIRCPTSYHVGDFCVAAGSVQITANSIICPKHYTAPSKKSTNKSTVYHINTSWCFICSSGGSLICCDTCPASFHKECLKLTDVPEQYHCDNCEAGRLPLYNEVVWVKLGQYRWWPAKVLHPTEVPANIDRKPHQMGEFPIQFCGSKEYYWINHGRCFLYEKDDAKRIPESSKIKGIDHSYRKGLIEASKAFEKYFVAKNKRETLNFEKYKIYLEKKPPFYQKIKTNRPYGDCPVYSDAYSSEVQICECNESLVSPCNEDSDCINRLLRVECTMSTCRSKHLCLNMQFQRRSYPPLHVALTKGRGWGLHIDINIKSGRFIIEYVGELITMDEFRRRIKSKEDESNETNCSNINKEELNFYYMTMDSNRMIDAGPKGNIARFMNHSCAPNCETQKWNVNGDTRVGIFSLKDIAAGDELTFNYQFEAMGDVKKTCLCGAANCSGYIGKKPINPKVSASSSSSSSNSLQSSSSEKRFKKSKVKKTKIWEDVCFRCYKEGELLMCDHKTCPKVYHLSCLYREKMPHGKWLCPWHHCVECGKTAVSHCSHCPNAYCKTHEITLESHSILKNICSEHDEDDIISLVDFYSKEGKDCDIITTPNSPLLLLSTTPRKKSEFKSVSAKKKFLGNEDSKNNFSMLLPPPALDGGSPMNRVTRTPSGRIRRIPSNLMKRVRCSYPGCWLAVIPSNFARHWKFKHADQAQPPIDTLTVLRGKNTSSSGDIPLLPPLIKSSGLTDEDEEEEPSSSLGLPSEEAGSEDEESNSIISNLPPSHPSHSSSSSSHHHHTNNKQVVLPYPDNGLRNDGKERKRAKQRNYLCAECGRPLIGSNFARHWSSKHGDLPMPNLHELEMEPLSEGEDEESLVTNSTPPPAKVAKKRKVICSECEMPMIASNFSRHWSSRHPNIPMPHVTSLDYIDPSAYATESGETSASLRSTTSTSNTTTSSTANTTTPTSSATLRSVVRNTEALAVVEPDDDEFEDVEEIEEEDLEEEEEHDDEDGEQEDEGRHSSHSRADEPMENLEDEEEEEEDGSEEVTVDPNLYSPTLSGSLSSSGGGPSGIGGSGALYSGGTGGKRHKKVYCSECSMPMLCNNFRRHFQRRHSHMMESMPSIHTLEVVSDEDYDKTVPFISPYVSSTNGAHHTSSIVSETKTNSPAKTIKRKVICPACRMAMIGSNFGRHWSSKHGELEQPLLQHLEVSSAAAAAASASSSASSISTTSTAPAAAEQSTSSGNGGESGIHEAETVVCEPLFFGHDTSEDDEEDVKDNDEEPCGSCSFSTSDKGKMSLHRRKMGHQRPKSDEKKKIKKVWKKKLICPECNLQTISSNFTRHWNAKHGPALPPSLTDLEVITIDDPGFHDLSATKVSSPAAIQMVEDIEEEEVDPLGETLYDDVEEDDEEEGQVGASIMEEGDEEEGDDQEEDNDTTTSSANIVDDEDDGGGHVSEERNVTNNKINCNFDINSLLEDDDEDDDEDEENDDLSEASEEDSTISSSVKLSYKLL